jgi:hypothetical protein
LATTTTPLPGLKPTSTVHRNEACLTTPATLVARPVPLHVVAETSFAFAHAENCRNVAAFASATVGVGAAVAVVAVTAESASVARTRVLRSCIAISFV